MKSSKLFVLLTFFIYFSSQVIAYAQTEKEDLAIQLNSLIKSLSDRKTPPVEVGRLIDYASTFFTNSAKIEVDYINPNIEGNEYKPRKYFFRISKMGENMIIIDPENIWGVDKKGRITGLTVTENY
ncbi:hypothetical protein [Flammeovirga kamogawensis]|uniref:Uncharacterized protein n=1 Tax=Flammeovirga kamogawensis TaxID=373891 RepID=A0ABX8GXU1_9BACT|nr:hypothetical protein [Flammeovirga kamogawensis]MBB6460877.1 hypothetical protein [Flammeovirga kamogawensis]QWG08223.1 hypothetical protein KM029_04605 [Flammeovirga kamogawensis]TRX70026.1 hypothetical protein EO216_18540 [Flammeovirga kamogawensis]